MSPLHIWFVSIAYLVCVNCIFGLCQLHIWPVANLLGLSPIHTWPVTISYLACRHCMFGLSPLHVWPVSPPHLEFPAWPFPLSLFTFESSRFMLGRFMFPSLNDAPLRLNGAYPRSTLGRRRDSIETPGCPTLHGASDCRLEASLITFIPNPT
ncbi:hypothetical protein TNCV_798611 [Trichonephila clavipes]|nr:hypothetical protein TNCV_798611 [Trichonephila clavipes]